MSSAAVLGIGFAATALTARQLILAGEAWMLAPPKLKQFYKGGFADQMSRREAALILGIRESAAKNKVMEAHRKVMMANHPDAGGSPFAEPTRDGSTPGGAIRRPRGSTAASLHIVWNDAVSWARRTGSLWRFCHASAGAWSGKHAACLPALAGN